MPFASVEKLSDDEHIEKPKVETAKPTPTLKPPPTPKPVAVKAKAKSKSLPMKKQPTDDTPEEQTEEPAPKATATMKRPAAARNPAGSSGNPPDSPRPPALKRPAAAKVELKATKYKYHKKNMWGIKLNGKEMVTVGVMKSRWFSFKPRDVNSNSAMIYCLVNFSVLVSMQSSPGR